MLFGNNKTNPSNSSPSIHAIINQKTNEMTKGVNQRCSFFFGHLFECCLIEGDDALGGKKEVHT